MRERTTWNRDSIKQAATRRQAEDPRAMNQDHLSQQPSADKYVTGDPSTFAEDVHTPNSWDVEYANGQTKRDEIGMPEKRPETYNHPEKTASMDEATLLKKAALCASVAKLMLRGRKFANGASFEAAIEDQSVGLMHMPNAELVATAERLAADEGEPEPKDPPAQGQQAAQDPETPAQAPAQQQQAAQPPAEPPAQGQQQQQQAAPQQNLAAPQDLEAQVQQLVQKAMKQQAQQTPAAPQVPPAAQQPSVQPTAQDPMVPTSVDLEPTADDMLLDQMLAPEGDMGMGDMGIEMEAPTMDVGDVVLAHEDEVLKTLFANEESDAQQAQQDQGGEQQGQKQAGIRTASTRTVGTRPTGGVSKVGGAPSGRSGGDVDKLAALWPSAPDVRDAFGMK